MFIKTAGLKKLMKAAIKGSGVVVGYVNNTYLVYTNYWGVSTPDVYASNKFKAAVIELIGDFPNEGECYHYRKDRTGLLQEEVTAPINPYQEWLEAKDAAKITVIEVESFPHKYVIVQRKSDLGFIGVNTVHLTDILSRSELDKGESMPQSPALKEDTLYLKNENMFWWVKSYPLERKIREIILGHLKGINFFADDWDEKEEE